MTAYFDNSATTKPLPEAVDAVARAMTETWGNPSSLHAVGDAANEQLEAARRTLAAAFPLDVPSFRPGVFPFNILFDFKIQC